MKNKNNFGKKIATNALGVLGIIILASPFLAFIYLGYATIKDYTDFNRMKETSVKVPAVINEIYRSTGKRNPNLVMWGIHFKYLYNNKEYITRSMPQEKSIYSEEFIEKCYRENHLPDTTSFQPLFIDSKNPEIAFFYNPRGRSFWGWYKNSEWAGMIKLILGIIFIIILYYLWKFNKPKLLAWSKKIKEERENRYRQSGKSRLP